MLRWRCSVLVFLVIVAAIATVSYIWFFGGSDEQREVVAVVNGKSISFTSRLDSRTIAKAVLGPEANETRLQDEIYRIESRHIAGRIHGMIFDEKIIEYGISVTEEEMDQKIKSLIERGLLTDEMTKQVQESIKRLRDALQAWHSNPEQTKAIYDEKLAPFSVTIEQWQMHQALYDKPEKLSKLVIPKNLEEIVNDTRRSSRKDVLHEKLENIITKNVSVSTEEVQALYKDRYSRLPDKPTFDELKEQLHSELITDKKNKTIIRWWKEQYNKSDIEIKDPRFQNVLNILRNKGRFVPNNPNLENTTKIN